MQEDEKLPKKSERKKNCSNCGAEFVYSPGTTHLVCEYCGNKEEIISDENGFQELELKPYLEKFGSQSHSETLSMLHCKNCGANQHIEDNYKSLSCVYCAMPLIVEEVTDEEWILPGAILPFQINSDKAQLLFKNWVNSLWFAPDKIKKAVLKPDLIRGVYLPYWTFDAQLFAEYSGQRGTYYYVDVSYNTTENGRTVTRSRRERRTRWTSVNGTISGFIDDTLIKASIPKTNRIPSEIECWNLQLLEAFSSNYLSGFVTEKYTISLQDGHIESNKEARQIAENWACRDIGGDTQRVHSIDMRLTEETFKHILLPIYISSFNFSGKTYHFFVNGENGTISGDRPYSFWKIFFLILLVLIVVGVIAMLAQSQ